MYVILLMGACRARWSMMYNKAFRAEIAGQTDQGVFAACEGFGWLLSWKTISMGL